MSLWDYAKVAGGAIATGMGGGAVTLGAGLYDALGSGNSTIGDALLGEQRQYDMSRTPTEVGQYGNNPGMYEARYNGLEGERLGMNQAAGLDNARAGQDRQLQAKAANSYQDVLSGKAPSLAQMQMQQGTQQAAMNAQNMAASARGGGGNQLMAQQMAQRQNTLASQDANMQAGMLRAKEQDAARTGLSTTAGQMRAGDLQGRGQSLQQSQGLMGAQETATEHYDAQKLGLAQLNSGNYNTAQGVQQTQDTARDQRKTETVKQGMSTLGQMAAKGSGKG